MKLRHVNGLQRTYVSMKSAGKTQAEVPELNPKPMAALFPLHEWKKKEERRSYRLPDSLCNGVVKPLMLVVALVHALPIVATSAGKIGYSGEPNEVSRDPN